MKSEFSRIATHKIVLGLVLAIVIALLLTAVSVWLYVRSGVASLDLSRPGYEAVRKQVETGQETKNFQNSGPINDAALQEFKGLYGSQLKLLNASGYFSDQNIEDSSLRFTAETQALPNTSE